MMLWNASHVKKRIYLKDSFGRQENDETYEEMIGESEGQIQIRFNETTIFYEVINDNIRSLNNEERK